MDIAIDHNAYTSPDQQSPDSPGVAGLAWELQQGPMNLCIDVDAGTLTMREKADVYLPQFPKEDDQSYAVRLSQAVLYNCMRRTVKGLTGMIMRKDPVLGEDVPELISSHMKNVDMAGRELAVFVTDVIMDKFVRGHSHIFIDWHVDADMVTSKADEKEARPYWVHIRKEQVLRFRTENRGGETVLVMFAYSDSEVVPVGEFGEELLHRIRQYELVSADTATDMGGESGGERVLYRSWTRSEGSTKWEMETEGDLMGERMTRIPLVTDYAGRTSYMMSEPPLLDLAIENIRHYQVRSDRDSALHIANVPVLTVIGVEAAKVGTFTVGGAYGVALPEIGQDAKYVETSGNALDASRQELQDIEQRMASLGLAMLQRQTRAAETAEAKRLDKSEGDSDLSRNARGTQAAVVEAIRYHAMWLGLELAGDSIAEINKDFGIEALEAPMVTALASLVPEKLSLDTLWETLQRGEILPDTFDPEVEHDRIATAGESEMKRTIAMEKALAKVAPPTPPKEPDDAPGRGRPAQGPPAGGAGS